MQLIDKVNPTLFIALGGAGMEIAHRVRRRILNHAWGCPDHSVRIGDLTEFPLAQFVYYDADSYAGHQTTEESTNFSDDEKVILKLDIDKYLRSDEQLKKYPHIAEWFPISAAWMQEWIYFAEERTNYHMPTATPRFLSRLNFFDKYAMLKSMIQGKISSLLANVTNMPNLERHGLEQDPASLRVVVLASTAGSTGSGSFIDMGYLAKWLANRHISGAKVDLCLMLPGGFSGTRAEANTYAALMELETCMKSGSQLVKGWTSGEFPDLPANPYDDIFIFDTGNLAQKTAKETDLFDMVADILFESFIPSESSSRKSRIEINQMQWKIYPFSPPVDVQKYGSMKMMYSKAYSAFGQSIIDMQLVQEHNDIISRQLNDNLITMLEKMPASKRRTLFQNCLQMAMPWVEASVDGIWVINSDQYTCIIGVADAKIFEQKFGDEFRGAIPDTVRMPATKVLFVESGVPSKLTCYVGLSGFPLTALTKLPNWRESYEDENKKVPLHIHKDRTRFVHPLAPTTGELAARVEDFKLFVQAVALGVLTRTENDEDLGLYKIKIGEACRSVGDEKLVRQEGFAPEYRSKIQQEVDLVCERLTSQDQLALWIALLEYYSGEVYPVNVGKDEMGCDREQMHFPTLLCEKLVEEWTARIESKLGADQSQRLIYSMRDTLRQWSDEIPGSTADVYRDELYKEIKPKRVLRQDVLKEGWQAGGQRVVQPSIIQAQAPTQAPSVAQLIYYVAVDGKQTGPHQSGKLMEMVGQGLLTPETKVWKTGMAGWVPASGVQDLAGFFAGPPPLDDCPPPL